MSSDTNIIELKKICLNYGQTSVLRKIDFSVRKGEIHAVIGEHGAGKSSLAMILSGHVKPDSGQLFWDASQTAYFQPGSAKEQGIEIVMQEIEQYERLSIAQNLFANDPRFFMKSFFTNKELNRKADDFFDSLGFNFRSHRRLSTLKDTEKVLLELLKHLHTDPALLILDETFEKMTAVDINRIIPELKKRKEEGTSIIFITHRIDDVYTFADRVSVIRNGRILTTESIKNIDKINLIKLAYTQVVQESSLDTTTQEFYQLLKYNRAILENLPMNLIVVDEYRILRLLNNNAKTYFSIGDKPVIGQSIDEFFNLNGNPEILESVFESLKKRQLETFTVRLKHNSGNETINTITTYPIYDGTMYIGSMIIVGDITEQESLREKLNFSEKLGSVGLLAAGVSHEINNPLEIIVNEIDYLRTMLPDGRLDKVLDNIEEEVESIVQIVSNLVSFSDSASEKTEVIDLSEVLGHIIQLISYNAKKRNIEINYSDPESAVLVACNRTEVKQIILNIIKNSFEAVNSEGRLEISLTSVSEGGISYAKMVFRDTGPGISEDDKKNIFLPFFSKKNATGNNLGLGLSVSYGIVNKMNGKITVENHPESGCVFTILIPHFI